MALLLTSSFLSPVEASRTNFPGRRSTSALLPKPNLRIHAAKLPVGVDLPKEQPKLEPPFLGFTRTAEIWNSRAGMIGIVGIFILELILNKGLLQVIGFEVGKGLDIPL